MVGYLGTSKVQSILSALMATLCAGIYGPGRSTLDRLEPQVHGPSMPHAAGQHQPGHRLCAADHAYIPSLLSPYS